MGLGNDLGPIEWPVERRKLWRREAERGGQRHEAQGGPEMGTRQREAGGPRTQGGSGPTQMGGDLVARRPRTGKGGQRGSHY